MHAPTGLHTHSGYPAWRKCTTSKTLWYLHAELSCLHKVDSQSSAAMCAHRCPVQSADVVGSCNTQTQSRPIQTRLKQQGEPQAHQAAPPKSEGKGSAHTRLRCLEPVPSGPPGSTVSTTRAQPNFNLPAKTIQHTVYTKATFSRL